MRSNALKSGGHRIGQSATDSDPKPWDFPLGSPESRAAARAMLHRKSALSPYDLDCYILYACSWRLSPDADPNCAWIEETEIYQHGKVICDALYGERDPSHLDPVNERTTFASLWFGILHNRLPKPGDILRYEEIAEYFSEEEIYAEVAGIQSAWARRIPEPPCPFKSEGGKMLIRMENGDWEPAALANADSVWWGIVFESPITVGYFLRAMVGEPPVRALVFIEGKKRWVGPLEPNVDSPKPKSAATSASATP
jgi:hypothetical protein